MTSCTRGISLKYMLRSALQQYSRGGGARHMRNATVLHDLGEAGTGKREVKVTLADHPGIIVCHHPPNKV